MPAQRFYSEYFSNYAVSVSFFIILKTTAAKTKQRS